MKQDILFKEVERIAKKNKLMELHYDVESFPAGEPYFTTTQETDIRELIMEGVDVEEIISIIKLW
jgi:hypothetical protein